MLLRAQATNRFRSIKAPIEKRSSILRCYESASRMAEKTMVAESPNNHPARNFIWVGLLVNTTLAKDDDKVGSSVVAS